jgi:predicted naringenin-chalcone synthase
MKHYVGKSRKAEKVIARAYAQSGIEKRHSVIANLTSHDSFFFEDNAFTNPSTKARNDLYTQAAKELFVCAAHRAIAHTPHITEFDITHVITVSCTGFFAPGPDIYVVKELGLNAGVQRFHLGFMGCYAAFPALKMARAFCEADPNAVVLVICLELCSLHLQVKEDVDSLISASVFADGAAAVIVSAQPPEPGAHVLELGQFASALVSEGEKDMAWMIGDHGFDMVLSTYVPQILEANVGAEVETLLAELGLNKTAITHWAIHPGGRAILDKVAFALELDEAALTASRKVLQNYGNMSSPSILFVLKELLDDAKTDESIYAMAFGPGLTVESGLFRKI